MNNIMCFENHQVEVLKWKDKILFNPYDVGECLELAESTVRDNLRKMNSNQVIKLNNSIVGTTNFRKIHSTGENFLTESGVYKLIFKSRKPSAGKFSDWVTDEVLPEIRKTGCYQSKPIQLELEEPYELITKYEYGLPYMTIRDFEHISGVNRATINWKIKDEGLFRLKLEGEAVKRFKIVNPSIPEYTSSLILIPKKQLKS